MENIENWLFPGTSVATVLKTRPMAMGLFEKYGMDPWNPDYPTIGAQCEAKRISLDHFFAEMKTLPLPGTDAEWNGQPIFHLIDFLSREHRQFLHGLLPAIKHALEQEHMRNGESLRRLRYLVEEWPRFSSALAEHVREEEVFLFPKILQYDYCLRHTRNHPDFQGGSVNVFVALRLLGNEKSQMQGIRRFLNELQYSSEPASQEGSLENRLEPLLQDLQARLIKHAELETEILFPMAKAVEKILIDKQISGGGGGTARPRVLSVG